MNKTISQSSQYSPKQLQFIIYPSKISTSSIASCQFEQNCYTLQIQKGKFSKYKGSQYIQSIKEVISFGNNNQYQFKNINQIKLTINKRANMNYALALYKNNIEGVQFQDKINLNLQKLYEDYMLQLRRYSFQINTICNLKQDNGSWGRLKYHLQKNKVKQSFLSMQKGYIFECSVQIKIDFDFIAQSKILKKRSNDNINTLESNKNNNNNNKATQIKRKNEQQNGKKTISQPKQKSLDIHQNNSGYGYDFSTIQLDSKPSIIQQLHQIKQNKQKRIEEKDLAMLNKNLIAKEKKMNNIDFSKLEQKRCELLSDIVEASNQGSSLMNNNGANTDRKASLMTLIPEESHQEDEQFYRAKTLIFKNEDESSLVFKRNNSLQDVRKNNRRSAKKQFNQYGQDEVITSMQKLTQNNGKSNLQENISTEISQNNQQEQKKVIKYKTIVLWIIALIIFTVINMKLMSELRNQLDFSKFIKVKNNKKLRSINTKILSKGKKDRTRGKQIIDF